MAASALAQSEGGKKIEPPKSPATATPNNSTAKPEFPKIVKKKLYAKNDFRGKKAPEFLVEKWMIGKDAKAPTPRTKSC